MKEGFHADSALITLSGCTVEMHCPVCQTKRKKGDDVIKDLINSRPVHEAKQRWDLKELSWVIPRLRCCKEGRPESVVIIVTWAEKYVTPAPRWDMSYLLEKKEKQAA